MAIVIPLTFAFIVAALLLVKGRALKKTKPPRREVPGRRGCAIAIADAPEGQTAWRCGEEPPCPWYRPNFRRRRPTHTRKQHERLGERNEQ